MFYPTEIVSLYRYHNMYLTMISEMQMLCLWHAASFTPLY